MQSMANVYFGVNHKINEQHQIIRPFYA